MSTIELKLPKKNIQCQAGIRPQDLLAEFSVEDEQVLAAKFDNRIIDLYIPLQQSGGIGFGHYSY